MRDPPEEQRTHPESLSPQRVVRGGTLASLGSLASQAISLIGFIALARLAPPSTFGAYAAASILTGTGLLVAESGMQAAVIQRAERVEEAASTAFVANLLGGFGLACLAAAAGPLIGIFFRSGEIGGAAATMAGTIPLSAASIVPGALLARRLSFRFALIGPFVAVAYVSAAVSALAAGWGLWGLVLATYVATAAQTTSTIALSGWRPSLSLVSWEMWRSLARYGRPVVVSSMLDEVGRIGSTAVVGRVLTIGALGQFRSAQRFVLQSTTAIIYGSAYVLLPAFSRIWQDEKRFHRALLRALRTESLLVLPVSIMFIPLGQPLAAILLGNPWRAAGPIMMAMAGVGIATALGSISAESFKATGRTHLLPRFHALGAVLPVTLMLALSDFGATGMGLATSIAAIVVAGYAVRTLARITDISLRVIAAELRPAALSGAVMVAGLFLLDRLLVRAADRTGAVGVAMLALDLVAAAALYLVSLRLFSPRSAIELKELTKLLVARTEESPSTAVG